MDGHRSYWPKASNHSMVSYEDIGLFYQVYYPQMGTPAPFVLIESVVPGSGVHLGFWST